MGWTEEGKNGEASKSMGTKGIRDVKIIRDGLKKGRMEK